MLCFCCFWGAASVVAYDSSSCGLLSNSPTHSLALVASHSHRSSAEIVVNMLLHSTFVSFRIVCSRKRGSTYSCYMPRPRPRLKPWDGSAERRLALAFLYFYFFFYLFYIIRMLLGRCAHIQWERHCAAGFLVAQLPHGRWFMGQQLLLRPEAACRGHWGTC